MKIAFEVVVALLLACVVHWALAASGHTSVHIVINAVLGLLCGVVAVALGETIFDD